MPSPPPPRFPDEVERLEAAEELEHCLRPLTARCDELVAAPTLPADEARLLYQLTEFIAAVGRYDAASDRLLDAYRHALEHAERPQPVPTLEQALLAQLSPAELLAHREADPVYRLGYVQGHRKGLADTAAKYERVTSLYAQHAVLVPPPTYQPSPLIARLKKWVATRLMTGPLLPVATRRLLLNHTPTHSTPTTHGA